MTKKRGWYLIGRFVDRPADIYLMAGPYGTRRQAKVWYDGASKVRGLHMACEFVEAKTIDQWRRLGILHTDIWEPGGPMLARYEQNSTRLALTIAQAT